MNEVVHIHITNNSYNKVKGSSLLAILFHIYVDFLQWVALFISSCLSIMYLMLSDDTIEDKSSYNLRSWHYGQWVPY